MRFIDITYPLSQEETVELLSDNKKINENVRFDEKRGRPNVTLKEKGKGRVVISCQMVDRPTKDNGFLVGTYFTGKFTFDGTSTRLKGVILTAPIYHLFMILLVISYLAICVIYKFFDIIPFLFVAFDVFMFKDEFRKQGTIERYLRRALRRSEKKQ